MVWTGLVAGASLRRHGWSPAFGHCSPWHRSIIARLLAIGLVGVLGGCHLEYPPRVVEPTQVGVITAIENAPGADVVFFDGHRLNLPTDEPRPPLATDRLMLYWGDEDPPYVSFARSARDAPGCDFHHQPAETFNEPGAIVMIMTGSPELGIRLPKAAGYEPRSSDYEADTGRFFSPPDFCLNAAGQVTLGG